MNVTPLIDVLLVLLIIFMVITPMMPQGEPAAVPQRPDPAGSSMAQDESAIVLALAADGSIRINHEALAQRDALADRLREIFARRANRVLFLNAHPDTPFELVAQVVDDAKLVAKVALMPGSR